jgi:hypothetical protein
MTETKSITITDEGLIAAESISATIAKSMTTALRLERIGESS